MVRKLGDKRMTLTQLQAAYNMYKPHDQDPAKLPAFMHEKARAPRNESVKNNHEEHDSQATIVTYLKRVCPSVLISASLNGELRPTGDMGRFYGWINKLKARGMLTGDPDLRLTWHPHRCIFLEKKRRQGGNTSGAQKIVHDILRSQGFPVYVLPGGIEEMREIIKKEEIPCIERF